MVFFFASLLRSLPPWLVSCNTLEQRVRCYLVHCSTTHVALQQCVSYPYAKRLSLPTIIPSDSYRGSRRRGKLEPRLGMKGSQPLLSPAPSSALSWSYFSSDSVQMHNIIRSLCIELTLFFHSLSVVYVLPAHYAPRLQVSYNTAIAACDKLSDANAAVRLLRQAREANIVPDAFSYNSVISALGHSSLWEVGGMIDGRDGVLLCLPAIGACASCKRTRRYALVLYCCASTVRANNNRGS